MNIRPAHDSDFVSRHLKEASESSNFFSATLHGGCALAGSAVDIGRYVIRSPFYVCGNLNNGEFAQAGIDLKEDVIAAIQSLFFTLIGVFLVAAGFFIHEKIYGGVFSSEKSESNHSCHEIKDLKDELAVTKKDLEEKEKEFNDSKRELEYKEKADEILNKINQLKKVKLNLEKKLLKANKEKAKIEGKSKMTVERRGEISNQIDTILAKISELKNFSQLQQFASDDFQFLKDQFKINNNNNNINEIPESKLPIEINNYLAVKAFLNLAQDAVEKLKSVEIDDAKSVIFLGKDKNETLNDFVAKGKALFEQIDEKSQNLIENDAMEEIVFEEGSESTDPSYQELKNQVISALSRLSVIEKGLNSLNPCFSSFVLANNNNQEDEIATFGKDEKKHSFDVLHLLLSQIYSYLDGDKESQEFDLVYYIESKPINIKGTLNGEKSHDTKVLEDILYFIEIEIRNSFSPEWRTGSEECARFHAKKINEVVKQFESIISDVTHGRPDIAIKGSQPKALSEYYLILSAVYDSSSRPDLIESELTQIQKTDKESLPSSPRLSFPGATQLTSIYTKWFVDQNHPSKVMKYFYAMKELSRLIQPDNPSSLIKEFLNSDDSFIKATGELLSLLSNIGGEDIGDIRAHYQKFVDLLLTLTGSKEYQEARWENNPVELEYKAARIVEKIALFRLTQINLNQFCKNLIHHIYPDFKNLDKKNYHRSIQDLINHMDHGMKEMGKEKGALLLQKFVGEEGLNNLTASQNVANHLAKEVWKDSDGQELSLDLVRHAAVTTGSSWWSYFTKKGIEIFNTATFGTYQLSPRGDRTVTSDYRAALNHHCMVKNEGVLLVSMGKRLCSKEREFVEAEMNLQDEDNYKNKYFAYVQTKEGPLFEFDEKSKETWGSLEHQLQIEFYEDSSEKRNCELPHFITQDADQFEHYKKEFKELIHFVATKLMGIEDKESWIPTQEKKQAFVELFYNLHRLHMRFYLMKHVTIANMKGYLSNYANDPDAKIGVIEDLKEELENGDISVLKVKQEIETLVAKGGISDLMYQDLKKLPLLITQQVNPCKDNMDRGGAANLVQLLNMQYFLNKTTSEDLQKATYTVMAVPALVKKVSILKNRIIGAMGASDILMNLEEVELEDYKKFFCGFEPSDLIIDEIEGQELNPLPKDAVSIDQFKAIIRYIQSHPKYHEANHSLIHDSIELAKEALLKEVEEFVVPSSASSPLIGTTVTETNDSDNNAHEPIYIIASQGDEIAKIKGKITPLSAGFQTSWEVSSVVY
ncbi:MAG: hypothetical protein WDZ28_04700 [Simkaniaceae bacterium]